MKSRELSLIQIAVEWISSIHGHEKEKIVIITLLHFPRPGIEKYIPYCCEPAPALNFAYQKVVWSVKMQVTLSNMG
jgi:hypothetical protein